MKIIKGLVLIILIALCAANERKARSHLKHKSRAHTSLASQMRAAAKTSWTILNTENPCSVEAYNGSVGYRNMITYDLNKPTQDASLKGIIFESGLLNESALSNVKDRFVSSSLNINGSIRSIVYLPYRNLQKFSSSAGTFSYNYVSFSDGSNVFKFYLDWYKSDLDTLIGYFNYNINERKKVLAVAVQGFATAAQGYCDNMDSYKAANGGLAATNALITTQTTAVANTQQSITTVQGQIATATTTLSTTNSALTALQDKTSALGTRSNNIIAQINQNALDVSNLKILKAAKTDNTAAFTTAAAENLKDFNEAIALLLAEDSGLSTILTASSTALKNLNLAGCNNALLSVYPN